MRLLTKNSRYLYAAIVAIWGMYATLMLMAPLAPGSARFQLSEIELAMVRLTILLPMLVVWLLAAYGAIRFRRYVESIKESPDGKAMRKIANGLGWFVVYIIFLTSSGAILPYFINAPYLGWLISGRGIITMLLALAGFYAFFSGSLKLNKMLDNRNVWPASRILAVLIPYCLFAMAFTYLFYANPDLNGGAVGSISLPTYVLPPTVLLVVIVLPYLFMWLIGLLAILNLRAYALTVPGVIYRKVLSRLVRGLIGVVSFTIGLQLFNVLLGTISKFTLGSILLIIYALILLIAISYGSIASGARRLAKIEANT